MEARTLEARARWARRGLASRAPLDETVQAMLLHQLYLAYYERRWFERARQVARQALTLDVLPDVFHQDAARADLALGDLESALAHLRLAARRGPASRRSFHLWTLASVLFLEHRYAEAAASLERAVRWGTHDRPLFRAHLALVRLAAGERVEDLQAAIDELASAPCGQGYGCFVLGHIAYASGSWRSARRFLEGFVRRSRRGRGALALALDGEIQMSLATLSKIPTE
ncbi:MAG TPA: tetratricopeptide repeat protein [Polyangiaceae bacterium]|nr:tetratricopeptide repeat protein [Polyangiaceae bacterium]